jgi:hypothetical protein
VTVSNPALPVAQRGEPGVSLDPTLSGSTAGLPDVRRAAAGTAVVSATVVLVGVRTQDFR